MLIRRLIQFMVLLAGCGGDDNGQPDANGDAAADVAVDVAFDSGSPPPVPAIQYLDGSVQSAPHVVPIVYSTDNKISDIGTFLTTLGGSSYWSAVTQEYNVGPLTAAQPTIITDPAPLSIDDSQIQPWLTAELKGDAGLPPPTLNNVYVIFYPSTTTVTLNSAGWTLCKNNLGYHESIPGSPPTVYAVVPDCGPVPTRTTTALDSVTSIASHELIEAATDPLWSSFAWVTLDAAHAVWSFDPGVEVGDMCAFQPQSYQRLVGSYVVQRSWSNASAAAGHDPCVPPLAQPYFNAIPLFPDQVPINGVPGSLGPVTTSGVKVAVGASATIPVQLFADGPTTAWTVDAKNEPVTSTDLSFTWDTTTGNAGDVLNLTITRTKNDASGKGGSELRVNSYGTGVNATQQGYWWGFVAQ